MAIGAAGQGTRSAIATARPVPSPRCGQPPNPAGAVTLRDLTVGDCTVDAEPTMMVRSTSAVP
jgi:hypothetical protein